MSIRFLLILALSVAVALLCSGPFDETTVIRTGRELDLAIVGHGFFVVSRIDTADAGYTRAGCLEVNAIGQLMINDGSFDWILDPPIQIQADWERVAIHQDGRVQCLIAGNWLETGQIQMARFMRTPAFADVLAVNSSTDESGPPFVAFPSDTQSVIQQGWIERQSESSVVIARNLLIAAVFSILLNAFVAHGRVVNAHTQTEPSGQREPPMTRGVKS